MTLEEFLEAFPGLHAELASLGAPAELLDKYERLMLDLSTGAELEKPDKNWLIAWILYWAGPDALQWLADG